LQQYGATFQKFLSWYEKGDTNESRVEWKVWNSKIINSKNLILN
jgi:hypothetical protein